MNNINEQTLKQLGDTRFLGEVTISVKKKYKPTKYVPFKMFGMDKTNMSLLKALDLIEGHRWRTRAFKTLLMYLPWNTNVITLPSDLYTSAADKRQFNTALQYLGNSNIAIKITRNNTKGISVPYRKNSWILNPKIVYIPDAHEADCIIWKSMSGNEP